MAVDEKIANRVREALMHSKRHIEEKRKFGGLIFMVDDKMCMGIRNDGIMCRIDPTVYEDVLETRQHCRSMQHGKRTMKGFVYVDPEGYQNPQDFSYWLDLALDYNTRAKPSKKRKK